MAARRRASVILPDLQYQCRRQCGNRQLHLRSPEGLVGGPRCWRDCWVSKELRCILYLHVEQTLKPSTATRKVVGSGHPAMGRIPG